MSLIVEEIKAAARVLDTTLNTLLNQKRVQIPLQCDQNGGFPGDEPPSFVATNKLANTMKRLVCAVAKNPNYMNATRSSSGKSRPTSAKQPKQLADNIKATRENVLQQRKRIAQSDAAKLAIQALINRDQNQSRASEDTKIEVKNLLDLPNDVILQIFKNANVVLSELCTDGKELNPPRKTISDLLIEIFHSDIDIILSCSKTGGSFEQLVVENPDHSYHFKGKTTVLQPNLSYEKATGTNIMQCALDLTKGVPSPVTLYYDGPIEHINPEIPTLKKYSKETFTNLEWVEFVLKFILNHFEKENFEILVVFQETLSKDGPELVRHEHEALMEINTSKGEAFNEIINAAVEILKPNFKVYMQIDDKYDFETYTNANTIVKGEGGGSNSVTYKGVTRKLYKTGRKTQVKFQKEWVSVAEFKKRVNRLKK